MAYYLQLDGTTASYIQAPSMTYDEIELDIVSEFTTGSDRYYLDSRTGAASAYFYKTNSTQYDTWGASFVKVFIDDVQVAQSSGSAAVVPLNQRVRVRLQANMTNNTNLTDDITFFARYTNVQFFKGKAYGIKIWLDGVLQAHYDLTLGNVQDQSGNGRHATLTGGTWINDGGTPVGTDVSYPYATKQNIYADRSTQHALKQSIYADRNYQNPTNQAFYEDVSAQFPMKQVLYVDASTAYALRQELYADQSWDYPMEQQIYADYVLYSADFPLKQIIYEDQNVPFPLKQAIYEDKVYVFATEQRFYDPSFEIVGRVRLSASRELYVYLVASRDLRVRLQGGLVMTENQNFVMKSGNSRIIEVPVSDVDLTGATAVKWVLHQNGTTKASKDLTRGITITETGATSEVEIKLDPVDTSALVGDFSHEMEVTDAQGHVSTVMTGRISILKDYVN